MRSLDETIEMVEHHNKFYANEYDPDVLHYLREYRQFVKNLANALINAYKSIEPYIEEIERSGDGTDKK